MASCLVCGKKDLESRELLALELWGLPEHQVETELVLFLELLLSWKVLCPFWVSSLPHPLVLHLCYPFLFRAILGCLTRVFFAFGRSRLNAGLCDYFFDS